tara:strand:+ start:373 stop:561 length:189 start_codon:yes stop_codon:yes gene_type:complete
MKIEMDTNNVTEIRNQLSLALEYIEHLENAIDRVGGNCSDVIFDDIPNGCEFEFKKALEYCI